MTRASTLRTWHLTALRFSGCGPRAEREGSVAVDGPQSADVVPFSVEIAVTGFPSHYAIFLS